MHPPDKENLLSPTGVALDVKATSIATSIELSPLPKTWLIDIDGTIFKHNSHLEGHDELLPGVTEFMATFQTGDIVVLMTARSSNYREQTCNALERHGIRYDRILFDLPFGERVLINDVKPSGLRTAYAMNLVRDQGLAGLRDHVKVVAK